MVKQQVFRFLDLDNILNIQDAPRMAYRARGGNEQLRRRVAGKFADGDVGGAVREFSIRWRSSILQ